MSIRILFIQSSYAFVRLVIKKKILLLIQGMKKEWILSDDEKKQKRAKIEENRARKRSDHLPPPPHSPSPSELGPPPSPTESTSSVSERPQARVLPSSRSSQEPPTDGGGPSRNKVRKFKQANEPGGVRVWRKMRLTDFKENCLRPPCIC